MNQATSRLVRCLVAVLLLLGTLALAPEAGAQSSVRPPEGAAGPGDVQTWGGAGDLPTTVVPQPSDPNMWRNIRQGVTGTVSIPDSKAGTLVQSEGENWRAVRNGPLATYGIWLLVAMLAIVALFYLIRGRIRMDYGPTGRTVVRFNGIERFAHWLLATSFIVLGLTGLNLSYGRYFLIDLIGADAFAAITMAGKYVHNYVAFAFMVGLVLIFVLWVARNLPTVADFVWLAKGGGLFTKGVHPPSWKFNAGQKILFWVIIVGGASVSLSGIMLLFPFQLAMFAGTFKVLNTLGLHLPTDFGMTQEMQLAQLWHAAVAMVLIAIIIAHIYIGSLGMVGAFDAMGTGRVDENWARQHHPNWAEQIGLGSAAHGAGEHAGGATASEGAKAR